MKARGFTLIELMMTLAIMAVLAMVTLPLAQLGVQRAREQDLRTALIQIREALDAYKLAADQGHIQVPVGGSGYPPSLAVLVEGVKDMKSPTGRQIYFLRALPADPFASGAPVSGTPGGWGLRSYASTAAEPKPGDDVFDVYSQAEGKGLNGVPYRQW
ncbi:MAG: hypothetical protein RI907_1468 [Pseudomonadota bacterium]|jgi:general secretion pathway protein G